MSRTQIRLAIPVALAGLFPALPAVADTTFFSTGNPNGKIATASRPESSGQFEIESADDFILFNQTSITGATFTGLLPAGATPEQVVVEVYRVFPNDSNVARTRNVPTRVNSPSDVALVSRDSTGNELKFSTDVLNPNFAALNSVQPGGIHPKPNQTTTGNGPVSGEEVRFNVTFATPLDLPADHYFFVPQVRLDNGDFLWLSVPKLGGAPDLQSWTRDTSDGGIDPDWLRVGTDIVGTGAFNAAFSLSAVPEPSTWATMLLGFVGLSLAGYRASKKSGPSAA